MAGSSRKPETTTLSPLYYLNVAGREVRALLATAMEGSPLTPDDYAVYSLLFEVGPISATQLSREAGMPLTTALDLVRTLERRGHLIRRRDPRDQRAMSVRLSPAGLTAQREAERFFTEADRRLRRALGRDSAEASRLLVALADAAVQARQALHDASRPQTG